jgi:Tfp pilus assembly protein FimT
MRESQQLMSRQRGVSLSGLIVVLALLGVLAVLSMKIAPSWLEYRSAKAAIAKAKAAGGSVGEMRASFDKNAQVNDISSIKGRDLVFSADSGDTEISFAYQRRIPLADNVSLMIDYAATTDRSGVAGARTASAAGQ